MIAVRKIVVAIDFGEPSTRALGFGRMVADVCGSSLHLLHVIGCPLASPETVNQQQRDACHRLDALLDHTDRTVRHATTSCLVDTPACAIVRYVIDNDIDLIVMGTHTHGPTFQMVRGSIAQEVIRLAPCAVLAVKGGDARPRDVEAANAHVEPSHARHQQP